MTSFYNISNHPAARWATEQKLAAKEFGGEIIDLPFPQVDPEISAEEVSEMADCVIAEIPTDAVVMVQGEFSLTYAITRRLCDDGHRVVVACSAREVEEVVNLNGSTTKRAIFHFVRFRDVDPQWVDGSEDEHYNEEEEWGSWCQLVGPCMRDDCLDC